VIYLTDVQSAHCQYIIIIIIIISVTAAAAAAGVYNSVEHNPYSEANRRSASHKFPRLLCDRKVPCRVHKSAPPFPVPRQLNPVTGEQAVSLAPVFSLLCGLSSRKANTCSVDSLEIGYDSLL
jgi:hypothetical protein